MFRTSRYDNCTCFICLIISHHFLKITMVFNIFNITINVLNTKVFKWFKHLFCQFWPTNISVSWVIFDIRCIVHLTTWQTTFNQSYFQITSSSVQGRSHPCRSGTDNNSIVHIVSFFLVVTIFILTLSCQSRKDYALKTRIKLITAKDNTGTTKTPIIIIS